MNAEPDRRLKLLSMLLQHPWPELHGVAGELRAVATELPRRRGRREIETFLEWLASTPLGRCQRAYTDTFDFSRGASLYLTYHRFGDMRQRGLALLRVKQRYAAAGFELDPSELPDYLPVMLEFAALVPGPGGELLAEHRDSIELVRRRLDDEGSPYASLLHALASGLPRLTRAQAARMARLAVEGPPTESVGLEPFAPPEVMPPASDPASVAR